VSHTQASSIRPALKSAEKARITTNAPLSENVNAAVTVGDTVIVSAIEDKMEEATIEILDELEERENVRGPGSDIKLNPTMITNGTTITSIRGEIGMLAAANICEVPVHYTPRVGVISAGDEVTDTSFGTP
jgi:molybdopterin biosynthesis enzyme